MTSVPTPLEDLWRASRVHVCRFCLGERSQFQSSLQVTKLSTVGLTILREDIQKALETKFPGESYVKSASTLCFSGTSYSTGMILAHGSTGGLPHFVELIQVAVVKGKVRFIVKCLNAWYVEHLGSYQLENTRRRRNTRIQDK